MNELWNGSQVFERQLSMEFNMLIPSIIQGIINDFTKPSVIMAYVETADGRSLKADVFTEKIPLFTKIKKISFTSLTEDINIVAIVVTRNGILFWRKDFFKYLYCGDTLNLFFD